MSVLVSDDVESVNNFCIEVNAGHSCVVSDSAPTVTNMLKNVKSFNTVLTR